jgi:hypothetical protein
MKLIGLCMLLLLTSCAYPIAVEHKDYPLDWPKPAPAASGCPDLGGRYRNQGDVAKMPLARWALPQTSTPMEQIQTVEIDGPRDGELLLRFFAPPVQGRSESEELGSRRWQQEEDFKCEDGWLVLSKTRLIPLAIFVTSDVVRFALAADRSLVVEKREDGGGVLVVLPAYLSYRSWQRYARVER